MKNINKKIKLQENYKNNFVFLIFIIK